MRKSFLAVSIILVLVIGGFLYIYIQDSTAISARELTINDIQTRLVTANNRISNLDSQLTTAQNQISTQQAQIDTFEKIIHLNQSSVKASSLTVNQNAGQLTQVTSFYGDFAGFVVISGTSTTSNGYMVLTDSFQGYPYNQTRYVFGNGRDITIPVLPGNITISFGNTNAINGATATLTVTYYY